MEGAEARGCYCHSTGDVLRGGWGIQPSVFLRAPGGPHPHTRGPLALCLCSRPQDAGRGSEVTPGTFSSRRERMHQQPLQPGVRQRLRLLPVLLPPRLPAQRRGRGHLRRCVCSLRPHRCSAFASGRLLFPLPETDWVSFTCPESEVGREAKPLAMFFVNKHVTVVITMCAGTPRGEEGAWGHPHP